MDLAFHCGSHGASRFPVGIGARANLAVPKALVAQNTKVGHPVTRILDLSAFGVIRLSSD